MDTLASLSKNDSPTLSEVEVRSHPEKLTLEWLLTPLSVKEFFDNVWEIQPHFISHGDRNYFHALFSATEFDRVLEYGQPRPPALRVVRNGHGPSSSEYLQSDGRLDLNQLRRFYAEGNTIVVNNLQRYWGPVADLTQAMQMRMNYRVEANVYLTPRGSQGLRPHYDSHDVIVLQLGGAKIWRLYRLEVRYPLIGHAPPSPFSRDELPEPRVIEMTAGDVLYVPRGWIHDAESSDESSLHLTLGVHPPMWHDFMAKALDALTLKHEDLRRAMPVGYLNEADVIATLRQKLAELAGLLVREGLESDALDMLQDDFVRLGRSTANGQFVVDLDRLREIDSNTQLVKRTQLYSRVVSMGDSVGIQFAQSLVKGTEQYREAMTFVARSQSPFAVGDLPGLSDEQRMSFAQQLVRDGLLAFADAGAG